MKPVRKDVPGGSMATVESEHQVGHSASQNWKGRFKDNSDKMRSGSIYEVADVLKSLTFLAKSKSLSFREKRMLDRAKFLIISEVSEVMRETAAAIEGRVDVALERCFTAKARVAARAS